MEVACNIRQNGNVIVIHASSLPPLRGLPNLQVMGGLFLLSNGTIVGYFYCLILPKRLLVLVIQPSSGRHILARITRLTTDPLFLEYS
jgi:hypothetical protein